MNSKLKRENPNEQIEVNFVEAQVEESVDKVKETIDHIIERYKSDTQSEEYKKMKELDDRKQNLDEN